MARIFFAGFAAVFQHAEKTGWTQAKR